MRDNNYTVYIWYMSIASLEKSINMCDRVEELKLESVTIIIHIRTLLHYILEDLSFHWL